jgi:hypothetical protein
VVVLLDYVGQLRAVDGEIMTATHITIPTIRHAAVMLSSFTTIFFLLYNFFSCFFPAVFYIPSVDVSVYFPLLLLLLHGMVWL